MTTTLAQTLGMNDKTKERLKTVKPEYQGVFKRLLEIGYANGLNPQITSAHRGPDEQDAIYAMGRTAPGKIVTNARRYQSTHNYGLAVDIHFVDIHGAAVWDERLYKKLWALAKGELEPLNLTWAGNWKTFKESAHFQIGDQRWEVLARLNHIDLVTLRPKQGSKLS